MEYCCHVWAGAPSSYLELLDKLHKQICKTFGPSLAASLECLVFFTGITFVDIHLNSLNYFCCIALEVDLLVILIDCMIFLSPFLDVTRMSISTVSFLARLDSGVLCLYSCFPFTYDLNRFHSSINRHHLAVSSF